MQQKSCIDNIREQLSLSNLKNFLFWENPFSYQKIRTISIFTQKFWDPLWRYGDFTLWQNWCYDKIFAKLVDKQGYKLCFMISKPIIHQVWRIGMIMSFKTMFHEMYQHATLRALTEWNKMKSRENLEPCQTSLMELFAADRCLARF